MNEYKKIDLEFRALRDRAIREGRPFIVHLTSKRGDATKYEGPLLPLFLADVAFLDGKCIKHRWLNPEDY